MIPQSQQETGEKEDLKIDPNSYFSGLSDFYEFAEITKILFLFRANPNIMLILQMLIWLYAKHVH